MKRILFSLLMLGSVLTIQAQSTAMDWTRNDCDSSISHHLFDELDSGYVVQIDFDMIPNCVTCNASVQQLRPMLAGKHAQYPGRLRYYCVGYLNSYTCNQLRSWKNAQNVDGLVFAGGASEVAYYGGMGMPTIVVLGGGTAHKVYYTEIGFQTSDTARIAQAIDSAMAESQQVSGINDEGKEERLSIYPNPANNLLHLSMLKGNNPEMVSIENRIGEKVLSLPFAPAIDIAALPEGIYFITLRFADGNLLTSKFLKQ
jgi:hypothetical protein